MQVAVETTDGLERRLTVDVPENKLAEEIDSRLKAMVGQVQVPGFRRGRVPMKVLSRRFGRQVRDEVVGELLRSSFVDAVETEKLRPAGGPTIDPISAEPGEGLSYTAVFEVYPDIDLGELAELELSRPAAQVEESDVNKMYDVLRRQRQRWVAVERSAAHGDRATIDFAGSMDGEEFPGGKAENVPLELGLGRMIPGFEEGILGAQAGEERDLNLSFPDAYHDENLAGKAAVFAVKVKTIETSELPEIDEKFIKEFGVDDGNMDSFRTEVRANMERELENAIKARTKDGVMNALLERNPVAVPNALVDEESARLLNTRTQELANAGIDAAQLALSADAFRDDAVRRVQLGLLLAEVVKAGVLKPDPMAVREQVERMAQSYEDPGQVINWFYSEPGRLSELESQVLEGAAVEFVLAKAKVATQVMSFDALMNPGQTTVEGAGEKSG